jgi:hypothetical protein
VERAMEIEREAGAQKDRSLVESNLTRDLTEEEYHARATSFALAHLLGALQQLAYTPGYLRQYRRTPALAAAGATRASDLVYHVEGFLVRTASFKDRCLQLCSAACHTGLNGAAVNQRAIASNSHIRSTALGERLKYLDRLCSPYAQARNQVVHQHGLLDEQVRRVELFLTASRVLDPPLRAVASRTYRQLVNEIAHEKADEFESFTHAAVDFSRLLFTDLESIYRLKQRQLAVA